MENNNEMFLRKTKRLDTIKKKAKELSILCNIDVCLVGSHQSQPDVWHTYPEDPKELDRIVNKYKKMVEEKEPKGPKKLVKKAILDLDVDKALEGMSDEELRMVLERADEVEGDVDKKLDLLLRKQNSGTLTPMLLDVPSNQTTEEVNIDKFESEGSDTTPMVSDLPLNLTMGEASNEEFDSKGSDTTLMVSDLPLNLTMGEASNEEFDSKGSDTTLMVSDLPLNLTMGEASNEEFDSKDTTPMVSDLPLNLTMGEASNEEFDSKVARKGLMLFGVYVTPAMEA